MKYVNKISIGLVVLLFSAGFVSCEKFLEEEPRGFLAPENFYENERDLFTALVGVYDALGTNSETFLARRLYYLTSLPAGESYTPALAEQRLLANYTFTNDHADINRVWTSMYAGIVRANSVIHRGEAVPMAEGLKQQYIGEARFLRALFYFYGVRLWGDLPLIVHEVTSLEEVNVERSAVQNVYAQIIADLEFAAQTVPASNQEGRATLGAIKALLAKVYLTRASSDAAGPDDYQLCTTLSKEVLDMPEHGLMPDYQLIFGPPNEFNRESLFEWQGDRKLSPLGEHSIYGSFSLPRGIRIFPEQAASDGGSTVSTIAYFNLYDERDYRRESTFVYEGEDFNGQWLSWEQFTVPYPAPCWKYVDRTATARNDFAFCGNFIVLRLADVYLMRAEALNELQGPSGEAYSMINAIRARARNRNGNPTDFPQDLGGLNKDEFRDAVLLERAVELGFEGHQWFDLVRTKRLVPTLKAIDPSLPVSEKHLLFPIPPDELLLNELLTQNPGW